jgi:hypothetical protein
MTFAMTAVPARIEDYSSTAAAPTTKDGGPTPVKAKTIDVTLDVTAEQYESALEALFPGVRFALKAAAGINDKAAGVKASAFVWSMARKLPPLTVKLTDTIGGLVLSAVNAKAKGKPTIRVAAGVERVTLPLRFVAALDEESLRRMEEHLGVDLFADVGVSQLDIADTDGDAEVDDEPAPAPKATRRKRDKVTVPLEPAPH